MGLWRAAFVLAVLLAACGGDDSDDGMKCGPNGECPRPFICLPTNHTCIMDGVAYMDARTDASP